MNYLQNCLASPLATYLLGPDGWKCAQPNSVSHNLSQLHSPV